MKIPTNILLKCPRLDPSAVGRVCPKDLRYQSTLLSDAVSMEALDRARPFEEIPGPKPLPLLGNLHRYMPVIGSNGEAWHHIRTRSQVPMLRPEIMKTYLPQMNVIADDLIRRMRLLRQPNHQVPKLIDEFFKWALESVTYILFNERMGCLDDNVSPDSMSQKYIQAVNQFFQLSAKVELASIPIWRFYPSLSPSYQKLKKVHDFFFERAMQYVQSKMKDWRKKRDSKSMSLMEKLILRGSPRDASIMAVDAMAAGIDTEVITTFRRAMQYVQSKMKDLEKERDSKSMSLMEKLILRGSPRDASIMAVDAMAAGIDTTSLTTAYVLRNLAANPEKQKKLQEEIDRIVPNKTPLTVDGLNQLSYLRACVKESMRLYPTVQGTSRTLDRDIVLSGYRIPANTQLTLNYNVSSTQEKYFKDAEKYIPERWLKTATGQREDREAFAFVPFGFGPRMCIGRRIAELEMFTLLTKIMQNFWVENKDDDLQIRFQLVLMISSPLKYEFYDRR
ncbi:putative cytochrome P450 49a1 like protein [Argiope bruennichi]|uniref:Putative cytochrome P450 49a1 like protein n=1 Tax=Argiope bruennichi TaxID=94029 RepID=A0A8T0EWR3_ARGBR|nr:putative cytochrome P450 49a1 like protein [Argiope bruennichi]